MAILIFLCIATAYFESIVYFLDLKQQKRKQTIDVNTQPLQVF